MTALEVKVGQVWSDNDKRAGGRKVQITEVGDTHAIAKTHTPSRTSWVGNTRTVTKIRLDRFNPNRQTGYTLVEDV